MTAASKVAIAICSVVVYIALYQATATTPTRFEAQQTITLNASPKIAPRFPSPLAKSARPMYRFSLIPNGAGSLADLRGKVSADPLLSKWFAGFKWAGAYRDEACGNRFVTFRRNGRIAWASKPIHLTHCEKVVSDGTRTFMLRCANEIDNHPHVPTAEINPGDLETPVDPPPAAPPIYLPPTYRAEVPPSLPGPVVATAVEGGPTGPLVPVAALCCLTPGTSAKPVAVAEPSTLALLLSASIFGVFTLCLLRRVTA